MTKPQLILLWNLYGTLAHLAVAHPMFDNASTRTAICGITATNDQVTHVDVDRVPVCKFCQRKAAKLTQETHHD